MPKVRPSVACSHQRSDLRPRSCRARAPRARPGTRPPPARCAGRGRCRSGDEVDRHRRGIAGIRRAQRRDPLLDRLASAGLVGRLVRAATSRAVVGLRRRSPRAGPRSTSALENGWPSSREPTRARRRSITLPLGLVGETQLARRRSRARGYSDAGDDRQQREDHQGRTQFSHHDRFLLTPHPSADAAAGRSA